MAATMFGSTETTFYVIAVYFGAVNVKKTRHAVPVGLLADFIAMFAAVYVVLLLFG
jgi:spore maturation protein B